MLRSDFNRMPAESGVFPEGRGQRGHGERNQPGGQNGRKEREAGSGALCCWRDRVQHMGLEAGAG